MSGLIAIAVFVLVMIYVANYINAKKWRRKNSMFCYFEYEYRGGFGSSREYGPMEEIDAVGAMQYRQSNGATITFEKFSTDIEEIHEIIDLRQFMHDKRKKREKHNDLY